MVKKQSIFVYLIIVLYLLFASNFTLHFETTRFNYFNYLSESFIKGKLHLISEPQSLIDLSIFNNHAYLYWQPAPALLLIPFTLLFGLNFSDIFFTVLIASINIITFYLILKQLSFKKIITAKHVVIGLLFFSFGTIHFYLSMFGRVWFTSQIVGLLFVLISIYFILNYHLSSKKNHYLLLSGIFFGLSVFSKTFLILLVPFYGLIIIKQKKIKSAIKYFLIFLCPTFAVLLLIGTYNYLRFGNFFETGMLNYHIYDIEVTNKIIENKVFSIRYLLKNIYYYFLNPINFKNRFPFIEPDPLGNSIFFVSPLYLLLFLKDKMNIKGEKIIIDAIKLSALTFLTMLVLFYNTGWFQFGNRYLLELSPFLIIFLLINNKKISRPRNIFLLTLSIFINVMGYFWWKGLNIK